MTPHNYNDPVMHTPWGARPPRTAEQKVKDGKEAARCVLYAILFFMVVTVGLWLLNPEPKPFDPGEYATPKVEGGEYAAQSVEP